ncbi:MAG: glutamate--cysteine ligase [Thermoanaerobaculia bacterium]|nr:glutamate--cysteine ligase [Thermoanaerobaculia bacterium]
MKDKKRLGLFEAAGIELEYMLVDAATLDVRPETDEVLKAIAGSYESEVELGELSWSNELVLHVIELKTNGPAPRLEPLAEYFQRDVRRINEILAPRGGRLMPTAMHPWMVPARDTRLWPHEYSPIYATFDRIFGCDGHGWSNLQSLHINLPFADDEEFGKLHAAIRLVLPLLPALAASSPVVEGAVNGRLDRRLDAYRGNAGKVPSVGGDIVPEAVFSEADYRRVIFEPMMAEIAPHDPDGILKEEFLNSRGAIARFSRGSIEIRVIDVQECPLADLTIAAITIGVLEWLVGEHGSRGPDQRAVEVPALAEVLRETIATGERAAIENPAYRLSLGLPDHARTAGSAWRFLVQEALAAGTLNEAAFGPTADSLLEHGPLARRILRRLGTSPARNEIESVYRQLCECLQDGRLFI